MLPLRFRPTGRSARSSSSAAALLLAGALACASVMVRSDHDPAFDFAALQSFGWLEPEPIEGANPFEDNDLLRAKVRGAVRAELEARGYRAESERAADFLVTFHVVVRERVSVYSGGQAGAGAWPYGAGSWSSYAGSYEEGTLVLDVLAGSERRLVWRGWGLDAVPTADREQDRIAPAVHQILARFPPLP